MVPSFPTNKEAYSTSPLMKSVMWSIPDDKVPGIDGFNSKFYKSSSDIVREDVV